MSPTLIDNASETRQPRRNKSLFCNLVAQNDGMFRKEVFTMLLEAKILVEEWGREYNQIRSYCTIGYRPPTPEAIQPAIMPATLT